MVDQSYGLGGPATSLVNATIIGIIICLVLVTNRIYWRIKTIKRIGIDDYLVLTSLCLLIVLGGTCLAAVDFGYGRKQQDLSLNEASKALLLFFLYQIIYKLNIAMTKLSVITLYLRIFHGKRWFRFTCLSTALIITLYTITAILVNIFECQPISWAWEHTPSPTTSQGSCINITAFWLTTAIVNLTTELTIILASIFVVFELELPPRQKTALIAILCLGIFVFTTSILRVTTLHPSGANSNNTTASTYPSTLWSTIEASTALTCACLPMLRTPIQRFFPRIFGSSRSAGGRSRSRNQHGRHGQSRLAYSAASPGQSDEVTVSDTYDLSRTTTHEHALEDTDMDITLSELTSAKTTRRTEIQIQILPTANLQLLPYLPVSNPIDPTLLWQVPKK